MERDALPMQMSGVGYYGDFVVYCAIVVGLTACALPAAHGWMLWEWLVALAAGTGAWTLIEYLLHRFALHGFPFLSQMHAGHHRAPRALIGTPSWISVLVLFGVVFLPAWRAGSLAVACGLTAGVAGGYVWYGIVHHVIHHRRPRPLAVRLVGLVHYHLRHHYATRPGNFGVSTPFWDRVFGTRL